MKTFVMTMGTAIFLCQAAVLDAQPYKATYSQCLYSKSPSAQVDLFGSFAFRDLLSMVKTKKNKNGLVLAVAETGNPAAKDFLLKILKNPGSQDPTARRTLREQAIEGLERFAFDKKVSRAIASLLVDPKAGRFPKEKAASFFDKYPNQAVSELLIEWDKAHGDSNTLLINKVARVLGKTPGLRMTRYLKKKLTNLSRSYMPWYREIAVEAGRYKRVELLDDLIAAAKKGLTKGTVVPGVYRALGLMGDTRAVEVLREAVSRKDYRIRYWAAVSIGLIGDKSAIGDLVQAFDKVRDYAASHKYVNRAAISFALAKLGVPRGAKFLLRLSMSKDPMKRMYGLMFLLMTQKGKAEMLATSRKIFDEVKPYKDIGGCPGFPFEQIFDAMIGTGLDEPLFLIQAISSWKKAGAGPRVAQRVLSRLPVGVRARLLRSRLLKGSWMERNKIARELERLPVDAFVFYKELYKKGDTSARVLAVRRAGLLFAGRAKPLLKKALRDSKWQVVDQARQMLLLISGRKICPPRRPDPKSLSFDFLSYTPGLSPPTDKHVVPAAPVVDYRHMHPLETTIVRRLVQDSGGTIWAATRYGLMKFDGMQWHSLGTQQGLCSDDVYDVAKWGKSMVAGTSKGLAMGHGGRFACVPYPGPVFRVAAKGKKIYAASRKGVLEFKGGKLKSMSDKGAPGEMIGAVMLDDLGALWVAAVPDQSWFESIPEAVAPLYRYAGGSWKAFVQPFVHYQGKIERRVGPTPGLVGIFDMATGTRNRIYFATSQGLMWFDHGRFGVVARTKDYWPWHESHCVAVAPTGQVVVGYPGYLDIYNKGNWKRFAYQPLPKADSVLVSGAPPLSIIWSDAGEIWWSGFTVMNSKTGDMGTVFRTLVRDSARVALPPDTLVSSISGGGFSLANPNTDLTMPNRARLFAGGQTIRVPANTITITALAKDPWDFGGVQYRFKVDEDEWTKWSKSNGLITPKILDDGIHRIQAQARDSQGNADPNPAMVRFSVRTKEVTVIKILDGQFQRVFPSQYLRLQKIGFGKVKLKNTKDVPVKVNLELKIEDFFEKPASVEVTLAPREEKWVTVPAPFSKKILESQGEHDANAIIEAGYSWDDTERSSRKSFRVKILDANAIVWNDPAAIASFINPADPLVRQIAANLYRNASLKHSRQLKSSFALRNFLLAMYAYDALRELGIKYKPDSINPFSSLSSGAIDTVQFPSQTLLNKTGDCDDLTVLYSSILENLNVLTAPVVVEGHVFVMFYSGVRQENKSVFPVSRAELVQKDGRLWIPVEITMIDKNSDFLAACMQGGLNFHGKYKPSWSQVVFLSHAWRDYPPSSVKTPKSIKTGKPRSITTLSLDDADSHAAGILQEYSQKLQAVVNSKIEHREDIIKQASLLLRAGMFDQSLELFQRALGEKDDFFVHYGLGAAHAGRGEMLTALVEFDKALKVAESSKQRFKSFLALAQCYKVDGNLVKARDNLAKALKINPAAKFSKRYRELVAYLSMQEKTKAASGDDTPPFFQELLLGL